MLVFITVKPNTAQYMLLPAPFLWASCWSQIWHNCCTVCNSTGFPLEKRELFFYFSSFSLILLLHWQLSVFVVISQVVHTDCAVLQVSCFHNALSCPDVIASDDQDIISCIFLVGKYWHTLLCEVWCTTVVLKNILSFHMSSGEAEFHFSATQSVNWYSLNVAFPATKVYCFCFICLQTDKMGNPICCQMLRAIPGNKPVEVCGCQ